MNNQRKLCMRAAVIKSNSGKQELQIVKCNSSIENKDTEASNHVKEVLKVITPIK
jgi:hypothetical protein